MRISDADGNALQSVHLALSAAEAAELADALTEFATASPGWHAHVSAPDQQTEMTLYREDDATAAF